jgi:hypothetical protein
MTACLICEAENQCPRFFNAWGERLPSAAPQGEVRKTVTVVFCDVKG